MEIVYFNKIVILGYVINKNLFIKQNKEKIKIIYISEQILMQKVN